MLTTRGLGGSQQLLCTFGHGTYDVVIIPPEEDEDNVGGGRKQFQVSPRRIYLKKRVGEPTFGLEDIAQPAIVLEIEGQDYELVEGKPPTAKQAIAELPIKEFEEKIERAMVELGISKSKAAKALQKRAAKELRGIKRLQKELSDDDDEAFWVLLQLSDM